MGKHGNGIKPKEDWSHKTKKQRGGNEKSNVADYEQRKGKRNT